MHQTGAVIFAAIEAVVSLLVVFFSIYRRPAVADDETPSWLETDWDAAVALDRLTMRYDMRQSG